MVDSPFGQGLTLHGYKPLTTTFREGDRVRLIEGFTPNGAFADFDCDLIPSGAIGKVQGRPSRTAGLVPVVFDGQGTVWCTPTNLRHVPWRFHRG